MSHTIIYDRHSVKLKDGNYILLLQMGDSRSWEKVNGRDVLVKHWNSLVLTGENCEDACCSLESMKERIAVLAQGYGSIAKKSVSNFFKSEKEMRTFLENGLKNPHTVDEYRAVGNCFQIRYWDNEKKQIVERYVRSEEEIKSALKELSANPNAESVCVGLDSRNLIPVASTVSRKKRERPQHGYMICATDEFGFQTYFKKKTPKHLLFSYSMANVRIFGKRQDAQKYMDTLPAVKGNVQYSVEEFNAPALSAQPEKQSNAVMGD